VFNDNIVRLITAYKAVHITDDDTTSLGVPTPLFESIEIDMAIREDDPGWNKSILEEYKGLLNNKAFTIRQGNPPPGRRLIPNRLILQKKYNTKEKLYVLNHDSA
jgi:hypothetical protein